MDTVKLEHAGAIIELPAETVVSNWLASLPRTASQPYAALTTSQPAQIPLSTPWIGSYWPGQGGIYAGIIRGEKNGAPDRFLIVPTAAEAEFTSVEWGNYGKELPDCKSNLDGHANSASMLVAGSDLVGKISSLRIEGHSDFYLPSRHELRLCYLSVPELFKKEWYWSSTQFSAYGAFIQDFDDGDQGNLVKDGKFRARAVRSIQVSNSVIR